jgi:glyoxylase-like metal-dependent hydrolase (beta-lactamase superfamily II)
MAALYTFPLGNWRCFVLSDGSREATLAGTFPGVDPTALAAAAGVAAAATSFTIGYNLLLVDTGDRRVLIDTGSGRGDLTAGLAAAGFAPADVDAVLLTHGDGDHIGGIAAFPQATFYLPAPSWPLWTDPQQREGMVEEFVKLFRGQVTGGRLAQMAAGRAVYGREVLPGLGERLRKVTPGTELLPGMRFLPAAGHRSDHFAVHLRSADATLLHTVDSLRHPLQAAHPDWTATIDSHPAQMAASTRRLLAQAAAENAWVFSAHLPFPGLGHVVPTAGNWRWQPAQ